MFKNTVGGLAERGSTGSRKGAMGRLGEGGGNGLNGTRLPPVPQLGASKLVLRPSAGFDGGAIPKRGSHAIA